MLSVQVLRFALGDKHKQQAPVSPNSPRGTNKVMWYTIETTCEDSPEAFVVRRRFQDFYTIRKRLLQESKQCATCHEFCTKLKALRFPKRVPIVFDHQLEQRKTDLTFFLRELVNLAATTGIKCRMNGTYLCNAIGMFLGMKSLLRFSLSQTDCDALRQRRLTLTKTPSLRRFSSFARETKSPSAAEATPQPRLRHRSVSTPAFFQKSMLASAAFNSHVI